MKKYLYILLIAPFFTLAQVGINTTAPNAQLDIRSSNQSTPANTDGLLIPKVDAFPVVNPTAAQKGMLVYLTTVSGANQPGFYYWNNPGWVGISSDSNAWKLTGNSGTNSATNFIGTTDNIDLVFKRNNSKAGLLSTSNTSFGDSSLTLNTTGLLNSAFGVNSLFANTSGFQNSAFGSFSLDSNTTGIINTAIGSNTLSSNTTGIANTATGADALQMNSIGSNNTATGYAALLFNTTGSGNTATGVATLPDNTTGSDNTANGSNSLYVNTTGDGNTASGYGALNQNLSGNNNTATGMYALSNNNTGSENTGLGYRSSSLFNLTNATAVGARAQVGTSNSLVLGSINGVNGATSSVNVGIGTTTPLDKLHVVGNIRMVDGNQATGKILASDANGTATWTTVGTLASGTLDQAYDFGGAGLGRTITADTGAVTIAGTDGLVSTGTFGSGAIAPSGVGVRMVWNPRKGAFRAGRVSAAEWDDANVGAYSTAFGFASMASGSYSTAAGLTNTASGNASTAFGAGNTASGISSTAYGENNSAISFGETVLGIGATNYTTSVNGATQFRTANATDRLFVIGNAIDANNNNNADNAERSDALVILKNGDIGIGSSTPQDKLHVVGNIRMVDGNQAAGKVLTSDANGTATWQLAAANAWGLIGNSGTNAATNFIGTTNNIDVVFKRNNIRSGLLSGSNTSFGNASLNANTNGINNSAFGTASLSSNTIGQSNSALGSGSLFSNTIGQSNSAFGDSTLLSNTTGSFNSAFGETSLISNTTGNYNSGFGISSLSFNTSGSNNSAFGRNADVNVNNLSNATAIGANALVGASNSLVLGSIAGLNFATASVNVGIGTTTPNSALEIVEPNVVTSGTGEGNLNIATNNPQNTDIGASITLSGIASGAAQRVFASVEGRKSNAGAASDSGYLSIKTNNVGTLAERVRVTNQGDVGIGTPAPGGQFELSLNEGRKPTSNTWTIPSDARLKNVNGIYEKGLAEILQLKPIRYHYKNTDKRTFETKVLDKEAYGFLAQEVQGVFPEAVGVDPDGYLNFDLHPILIASVNAMKELDAKNSQLTIENEALKAMLKQHDEQIAAILAELEKRK